MQVYSCLKEVLNGGWTLLFWGGRLLCCEEVSDCGELHSNWSIVLEGVGECETGVRLLRINS